MKTRGGQGKEKKMNNVFSEAHVEQREKTKMNTVLFYLRYFFIPAHLVIIILVLVVVVVIVITNQNIHDSRVKREREREKYRREY